ncbi:MAG: 1-deoxy-D-xylulose-5-phosphate synthase [Magnetococcales bacterium]|nr:1-deoxy-D-xylulose-5-phosphate synthase [Magnetococcales bacterium]
MRRPFLNALCELAAQDPRVLLLTADLGYTVVEGFAERFPDRFFNVGVAEQNMLGMATGLAEAGLIPFVYSIVPFAVLRPLEFIRNGPVRHGWPVRIVGVGAGFDYGPAGFTHHGLEDLAVLRPLPGLTILSPADHRQACAALKATHELPGPIYFRLGREERLTLDGLDGRFRTGRLEWLHEAGEVLILATGGVALEAGAAVAALRERGLDCAFAVAASLAPVPEEDLALAAERYRWIVTVEEHGHVGGLASLVAERLACGASRCRLHPVAVTVQPSDPDGSQEWYRQRHGLTAGAIAARVAGLWSDRTGEGS